MTVQITMTFANLDEATSFLAGKVATPKSTPATSPKPAAATSAAATSAAVDTTPTAPAADAQSSKELTFDGDVVTALRDYSAKNGNDSLKALLKKFGADRVPDLKKSPDDWAKVIAATKG